MDYKLAMVKRQSSPGTALCLLRSVCVSCRCISVSPFWSDHTPSDPLPVFEELQASLDSLVEKLLKTEVCEVNL